MKTETLQRAKVIEKTINDLKDRIKAISAIEDEGYQCTRIKLEIQAAKNSSSDYKDDAYSKENNIPTELKEKITEEMLDCAVRIKRAFEKEIKRLEKEFDTL